MKSMLRDIVDLSCHHDLGMLRRMVRANPKSQHRPRRHSAGVRRCPIKNLAMAKQLR